eukprot:m.132903 g.132903  ORF g.132903 m.132903 type:complete len:70 (+) comp14656_c0_seq1:156-365(+)
MVQVGFVVASTIGVFVGALWGFKWQYEKRVEYKELVVDRLTQRIEKQRRELTMKARYGVTDSEVASEQS